MKISNIFKSALIAAAAMIGLASCSDDGVWTPYEPEGTQYSFVRSNISEEFVLSTDISEVEVPVVIRRSSGDGAITLPLTVEEVSKKALDYYEVPTEVTFEDGSYQTTIVIIYKKNTQKQHRKITISFDKELASPCGTTTVSIDCWWVKGK